MSKEKYLHNRSFNGVEHKHTGQHSIRRALDSAVAKLTAWRTEPRGLPFAGQPKTVGDIFYDEYPEIEVYTHPDWMENVRRTNKAYNESISVTEDSRLKPD